MNVSYIHIHGDRAGRHGAAPSETQRDRAERLIRLDTLARLLDARFRVPGTRFRFGLDFVIGLVPVIGDTVTAAIGLYILQEARDFGLPKALQARMLANVGADWLIGQVPLVGDLLDAGYKANVKNIRLLERHLAERGDPAVAAAGIDPEVIAGG